MGSRTIADGVQDLVAGAAVVGRPDRRAVAARIHARVAGEQQPTRVRRVPQLDAAAWPFLAGVLRADGDLGEDLRRDVPGFAGGVDGDDLEGPAACCALRVVVGQRLCAAAAELHHDALPHRVEHRVEVRAEGDKLGRPPGGARVRGAAQHQRCGVGLGGAVDPVRVTCVDAGPRDVSPAAVWMRCQ